MEPHTLIVALKDWFTVTLTTHSTWLIVLAIVLIFVTTLGVIAMQSTAEKEKAQAERAKANAEQERARAEQEKARARAEEAKAKQNECRLF